MALAAGTRLGPYEVLDLLGAGGMGEVHRARDPRLEREVAIKVLPAGVACEPDRLARFAREAKAAAALNHPNILTVYDVGSATPLLPDGASGEPIPYVVAELLRGKTLRELVAGGQLAQAQALGYAVQIAHGLAAAHAQDLVHRDLKPENLFVTTDERVKILDFGLARATSTSAPDESTESAGLLTAPGSVLGTVAYMSPEQARGLALDQRTDIFSFGVVLYEMLSGQHPFRRPTPTATLAAILEADPLDLAALSGNVSPALCGIVCRCLDKAPESRFGSAHDLALALEAVRGTPGASAGPAFGERSPYPGLASFSERNAGVFFGREAEVQGLWAKLRQRRLLAVIAPSGAGKTSFVRAGLVPGRPPHWSAIVCTPGSSPLRALGRALVPELAREPSALAALVDVDDPAVAYEVVRRWRAAHGEALLVVDQFEELFTLNPPETQRRFAELLARLASDGDVHVLLSLRDDFLIRCSEHAALAPVFKDLTPLAPLGCDGLTRALVEPARRAGFRFEDPSLADEMIRSVEGARAALPLLAFAVSQLWDGRDRERKLLTRAAYDQMGGVAGALARHAEATLEHIGAERQGIVRELFRNLVTAHGTRAVPQRDELLSAFPERAGAEDVLRELVDARLLTSYDVDGHDAAPAQHMVEVVHESLLTTWPRLVRWQAQDEEGALLRDQLRQAAHLWEEKGRAADLLWAGTAYQEFELWRGRYQGALTALEEDFARAMRERVRSRRRLVRASVAATIAVLAAVAIVVSVSRHQAAVARDEARAEARRAESSRLLALGKLRLDEDPTEALAFATASLELADSRDARVFALRALAEGPPASDLPAIDNSRSLAFSPDGHRVAVAGHSPTALVWKDDGSEPLRLEGHVPSGAGELVPGWASNTTLAVGLMWGLDDGVLVWSATDGRRLRSLEFGGRANWMIRPPRLFATVQDARGPSTSLALKSWSLPDGAPTPLGSIDRAAIGMTSLAFDPAGRAVVYSGKRGIRWKPLPADASEPDRALGPQARGRLGAWGHSLLFVRNAADDLDAEVGLAGRAARHPPPGGRTQRARSGSVRSLADPRALVQRSFEARSLGFRGTARGPATAPPTQRVVVPVQLRRAPERHLDRSHHRGPQPPHVLAAPRTTAPGDRRLRALQAPAGLQPRQPLDRGAMERGHGARPHGPPVPGAGPGETGAALRRGAGRCSGRSHDVRSKGPLRARTQRPRRGRAAARRLPGATVRRAPRTGRNGLVLRPFAQRTVLRHRPRPRAWRADAAHLRPRDRSDPVVAAAEGAAGSGLARRFNGRQHGTGEFGPLHRRRRLIHGRGERRAALDAGNRRTQRDRAIRPRFGQHARDGRQRAGRRHRVVVPGDEPPFDLPPVGHEGRSR
jgi:hypothetical protein